MEAEKNGSGHWGLRLKKQPLRDSFEKILASISLINITSIGFIRIFIGSQKDLIKKSGCKRSHCDVLSSINFIINTVKGQASLKSLYVIFEDNTEGQKFREDKNMQQEVIDWCVKKRNYKYTAPFSVPTFEDADIRIPLTNEQQSVTSLPVVRPLKNYLSDACTFALPEDGQRITSDIRSFPYLIGKSECMRIVMYRIKKVAKTNVPVIITGETGTGKEIIAELIHIYSNRSEKPFKPINMTAIPESLAESELFGYVKGAFTGAEQKYEGIIMSAQNGTLFLDEIGDLPIASQARLLRVLESKKIQPLGTTQTMFVDFRLITATNKDLKKERYENRFRDDLFYRIHIYKIEMPPLRERPEDIPLLFNFFTQKMSEENECGIPAIVSKQQIISKLQDYDWPGNVRELKNFITEIMIDCNGKLTPDHISFPKECLENTRFNDEVFKKAV